MSGLYLHFFEGKGNKMHVILGIDTGGTYTDAVLFDLSGRQVLAKAKSPTTHEYLETGIQKSIEAVCLQDPKASEKIEKVVLSTTLATNAIVEEQGRPTGLIIIGDMPKGALPEVELACVSGKVNVKGKVIIPLNEAEVSEACEKIAPKVAAFAVSGMMSVRNAELELQTKTIIEKKCGLPVVCGHELSSQLGFHDRTVTCVLNAGLLPIIEEFIQAVQKALKCFNIEAPVFMVKGDGSLASLAFIRKKPIESILSGPAASMIGACTLAETDSGIVADMGGTTTDTAIINHRSLALSPDGAKVGRWQTQVSSAEISTWGLGGDTQILPLKNQNEDVKQREMLTLTGQRILPACRGGKEGLTPTDLLHLSGEYIFWDVSKAEKAAEKIAEALHISKAFLLERAEAEVLKIMDDDILGAYRHHEVEETPSEFGYIRRTEGKKINVENLLETLPVIAIGAPAGSWYGKLKNKTGQQVIVPEHYEVANAVGAACAGVEERMTALIRPDEETESFNAFIAGKVKNFKEKDTAVAWAKSEAEALCVENAKTQGAEDPLTESEVIETVEKKGLGERFVQTEISVTVKTAPLKVRG